MSENKWFVYMLRCSDDSLYTGVTTDPNRRLSQHNRGIGAKYTRTRLPVCMVYCEEVEDRSAALRREHTIKHMTRNEKMKLIK